MALSLPNASPFFAMLSMCFLISCSQAKEYVVGGSQNLWKFPPHSPDSLNHWANTHRFKIGDALIFKYDERTESVHEVNATDYERCNTVGEQHGVFNDGNTKVLLTDSGFRHFISGTQSHCQMGLKIAVVVMSNKTKKDLPVSFSLSSSSLPSPSPSPSPSPFSPSPSPSQLQNNQGVTTRNSGAGFIVWLVMMLFLV